MEELLLEIFDGCVNSEEVEKDLKNKKITAGNLISYCGCTTKQLSKTMTAKEIGSLGIELMKSQTQEEYDQLFLANEKFTSAVAECFEEMYD